MIDVVKQDDKLIGIFKLIVSTIDINSVAPVALKGYITQKLYDELAEQDQSGIFTYNILNINETPDLFGLNYEVIFEFIPNPVLIEELKVVTERLQIGL